jgi:hypothetical protein
MNIEIRFWASCNSQPLFLCEQSSYSYFRFRVCCNNYEGKSESSNLWFFYVMWTTVLYFPADSKLVQALDITYDEIFPALSVKETSCSRRRFWTPPHPPYSRDVVPLDFHVPEAISGPQIWLCHQMEVAGLRDVFSVYQTRERPSGPSRDRTVRGVGVQKCLREQDVSFTDRAWKISSYTLWSAWTILEIMWKIKGLMSKDIRVLFLSPLTSIHLK